MRKISYAGYRFAPEVIHQAIWLYLRFTLSFRDVEDLLAERGIAVSYETVRRWVNHFGPVIATHLRMRRPKPHVTWHLDEVYLKIDGRMVYLWRAVDSEGDVTMPAKHVLEAPARPKRVTILDALPVTAVGKIFKPALRDLAIRESVLLEIERIFGPSVEATVEVERDDQLRTIVTIAVGSSDDVLRARLSAELLKLPQTYVVLPAEGGA